MCVKLVSYHCAIVSLLHFLNSIILSRPYYYLDFSEPLTRRLPFTYTGNNSRLFYNNRGILDYAPHNLLLRSADFTYPVWVANQVKKNPNSIIETAVNTSHNVTQDIGTPVLDAWYTFSIDARNGFGTLGTSHRYLSFSTTANAFGSQDYAVFNLESGTVQYSGVGLNPPPTITPLAYGWYRCVVTLRCLVAASSSAVFGLAKPDSTGRNPTYLGEGNNGILLRNAQLSATPKATAYVETNATKLYYPRAFDFQDYNPTNFAPMGFLIEEQRTNLLRYSQDFIKNSWSKTDITSVVLELNSTAPDDTEKVEKITEGNAGTARIYQQSAVFSAGISVTGSIYLKRCNHDWVRIRMLNGVNGGDAWFNLYTGTKGGSASVGTGTLISTSVEKCPNGWLRCIITVTVPAANTIVLQILSAAANNSGTRVAGGERYQYGAQVEMGAFATSYIPSFSTIAVRDADIALTTQQTLAINSTQGTVFAQATRRYAQQDGVYVDISDGTINNSIVLQNTLPDTANAFKVISNGATQVALSLETLLSGIMYKIAATYNINNFAYSVSGDIVTDNVGSLPLELSMVSIGCSHGSANFLNGWLKQIALYDSCLSNTDLNYLTETDLSGPTNAIVTDTTTVRTFNWTNVPNKTLPTQYEYTTNGGETINAVTSKPITIPAGFFGAGVVGVRLKALDGNPPSVWLYNPKYFSPEADFYYDAINGLNTNNGQSARFAFKTLNSLNSKMRTVVDGQTLKIAIMPGVYEGGVTPIASDVWNEPTNIMITCYGNVVFNNSDFYGWDSQGEPIHTPPPPATIDNEISFINVYSHENLHVHFHGNASTLYPRTLIKGNNCYHLNNGVGVGNNGRAYVYDVEITGYIDGISTHNNSYCEGYNCYVHHCRKSALPMVGNSKFKMDYCIFEGMTDTGPLPNYNPNKTPAGTGSTVNFETEIAEGILNDCEIYPSAGEISRKFFVRSANVVFNRCKIGKYNAVEMGAWGNSNEYPDLGNGTYNDCFFNAKMQAIVGMADSMADSNNTNCYLNRCYGILTIRPRGGDNNIININYCTFKKGFEGYSNSLPVFVNFSYYLSPSDLGGVMNIKNSIFINFSNTVINIDMGKIEDKTFKINRVNGKWAIKYICFFNNSANWSQDISIVQNPLLLNPVLGPCNSENQNDWKVLPNSPCIGAGEGGSTIGIGII